MKRIIVLLLIVVVSVSCRISYKFNGASIDYSLTKTLHIAEFRNQVASSYPTLSQYFSEGMKDHFIRNTKLKIVDVSPDLEIEGEIVRYDLSPLAVKEDSYASQTRLTMAVRMRYRNNKDPQQDKEETFSAYKDFDSSKMLTEVQDQLVEELTKELVDQIFNATMSNW